MWAFPVIYAFVLGLLYYVVVDCCVGTSGKYQVYQMQKLFKSRSKQGGEGAPRGLRNQPRTQDINRLILFFIRLKSQ